MIKTSFLYPAVQSLSTHHYVSDFVFVYELINFLSQEVIEVHRTVFFVRTFIPTGVTCLILLTLVLLKYGFWIRLLFIANCLLKIEFRYFPFCWLLQPAFQQRLVLHRDHLTDFLSNLVNWFLPVALINIFRQNVIVL